jgi:hypothetical protein
MHDIRSSIVSGEGMHSASPLIRKKAKSSGKAGGHPEEGAASLMMVPIPRFESRSSNHRSEDRQPNVVESAILTVRETLQDVRVANVSPGGAMVTTAVELFIGEPVEITFTDCDRLRASVRWIKDGKAGVEFDQQTDIIASAPVREAISRPFLALVKDGSEDGQRRARPARVGLVWNGELEVEGTQPTVRLRNISSGGAMLDCEQEIAVGSAACLDLSDAGRIEAEIRWCRGGQVGIRFNESFDLQRLSRARPAGFVTEQDGPDDEEL